MSVNKFAASFLDAPLRTCREQWQLTSRVQHSFRVSPRFYFFAGLPTSWHGRCKTQGMTNQQPITDGPRQGASSSTSLTVGTAHLAAAYAEGSDEAYPSVLSTPALIGLIERACAATLQPYLAEGEMSVGVRVNIVHKSPTALGQSVSATAQFTHREGRLYLFDVQADDAGGVVATGEHARAIVKAASIERQAQERLAKVTGVL